MTATTCHDCRGPELFEHLHDGHDEARHRLAFAGIPIPSQDRMERMAAMQRDMPEVDVLQSFIDLAKCATSSVEAKRHPVFVHCWQCNRGGRGNAKDLCSAGWQHNSPSHHGCYLGTPIIGEPRKPPKLTRSQKRYRRFLGWREAFSGSFREFLEYEKREREA